MTYILNISSDFETVEQWAIPKQKQEKKSQTELKLQLCI